MAARMRSDQGGGQKDADAPSKPARSSLDGEAGEPIIGLKVFVVVVKLWELYVSYCKRIRERDWSDMIIISYMHCNKSSHQMSFSCTD